MSVKIKKTLLSLVVWAVTASLIVFIFSLFGHTIQIEIVIVMFVVFLSFSLWDLINYYFDEKEKSSKP